MGIYYMAVDFIAKEQISSPPGFSIKSPGLFHPANPFPGMVIMKNFQGCSFEIADDSCDADHLYFKDISEEVWKEYREMFSKYYDMEKE